MRVTAIIPQEDGSSIVAYVDVPDGTQDVPAYIDAEVVKLKASADEREAAAADVRSTAAAALRTLDDMITGWPTYTVAQRQDATLGAIRILRGMLRYLVAQAKQ